MFSGLAYSYVTHHGKRVVPLTGVLLDYPESVVFESSVKPSLGKPADFQPGTTDFRLGLLYSFLLRAVDNYEYMII